MYELVNTSLPNGLMPGTHGFATVAMTKGLPDTLRTRLESYCAYSHRTSAHDTTYFNENPVNWFHIALTQGEHVVGRVAPAEFDYTGRTNRLAQLFVFPKGEMPAIGGAEVLNKVSERFIKQWTGDARWLEADNLTSGRLRLEMPTKTGDAPAWRAMFGGEEGVWLAKGFSRLLVKNMAGSGKTIYFKTSTKCDVDGTKLLALFTDLIALLPGELRGKAMFATYPAALPQGTVCHLRGVYDRDRIFDAAAATQPWVDCEHGIVHNASLLPPEEAPRRGGAGSGSALRPQSVTRPQAVMPQQAVAQTQAVSANHSGVRRNTQSAEICSEKTNKKFLIYVVIAALVLVAGIVAGVYFCIKPALDRTRKTETELKQVEESVAKQQQSETNNVIANVKVKAEAETKADAEAEAKSKAKAEAIAKAKADAETAARAKANAEARAKARANVERKERMARETIAFKDAKVVKILDRKIDNVWPHATDRQNMTNGTLKVFWYDSRGSLTNCPAGFKEVMRLFYVSPKPDELAEKTSGAFLIWLDTRIDTNKVAYWDWSPLKNKKPEAWFATTDEVNLMEMCFGKRKEVRETWEKGVGGTFTIEYKVETKVRTSNETKVRTSKLKWKLIEGVEGNELLKVDNLVDEAMKKKKEKLEEEQKNRKKRIDDYKGQMSVASTKKGEYDSFTNQLAKVRQTLSDLNKNTKKNASEKKTEKDKSKEKTDLETKIRGLLVDEELKTCMSFCGHTLKYGDNKITGWEELLETCQTKIGKLEEEQKKEAANEKTMESRIRKDVKAGKYLIVKVEGGQ